MLFLHQFEPHNLEKLLCALVAVRGICSTDSRTISLVVSDAAIAGVEGTDLIIEHDPVMKIYRLAIRCSQGDKTSG